MKRIPNNRKKTTSSKLITLGELTASNGLTASSKLTTSDKFLSMPWTLLGTIVSGAFAVLSAFAVLDSSVVCVASEPKILEYSPESASSATAVASSEENERSDDSSMKFGTAGGEISKSVPFSKGILPPEILKAETEKFSPDIRRSYSSGIALESFHFEVEAAGRWERNALQLAQVLKQIEEIRYEADLTASLWRQPFFTADMRSGRMLLSPNKEQIPYRTSAPAKRMRLRICDSAVGMESSRSSMKPCRLENRRGEVCLTITLSSIHDFQSEEFLRDAREVLFRSALHDGKENLIFPIWLQEGLTSVFAGGFGQESESFRKALSLSELTEISENAVKSNDSTGYGAVRNTETLSARRLLEEDVLFKNSSALWVRYFLGANSGKTFFSFWGSLNRICSFAEREMELRERENESKAWSSEQLLFQLSPQIQRESGDWLRLLKKASESRVEGVYSGSGTLAVQAFGGERPQNFAEWLQKPNSGEIPVWDSAEALVLNASVSENQPLPVQKLTEKQKEAFGDMALLLQIVNAYRKANSENGFSLGKKTEEGVLIQEFGKSRELRRFSTIASHENLEENTQENVSPDSDSEGEKTADDSQKVTAEELQRLEDVYAWFVSGESMVESLFFDFNGYPVSPVLRDAELEKLFHPKDRAFLLQEYEGNPVLSATFTDGSVLHVILDENEGKKSDSERLAPGIRIFGMEAPETEANSEF